MLSTLLDLGPAVDVQGLAGDVRRLVAAQERRGSSDVLGVTDTLDRVGLGVHLPELLDVELEPTRGVVGHLGGDETRSDRVHVDPEPTELEGQRAGEALYTGLRRGVVRLAAVAVRRDAGEVEDLPVLLRHERLLGRLAHQEGALEVHVDHRVPVVLTELEQQVVPGDAGVVHQDVQSTELLEHAVDSRLDGGTVGDVAPDADGLGRATELTRGGLGLLLVQVEYGDSGTLLGEPLGGSRADPSCSTGDDRHPSVVSTHQACPLVGGLFWPRSL